MSALLIFLALDALDMALLDARVKATASGRVYVNVIQPVDFDDAPRARSSYQGWSYHRAGFWGR